ncbi:MULTISPECIES: YfhO family protein [Streptomyces]|uniref:YfhO family protein n=1 Tax=Streptomyces doudnae TaxID=3075536 RepID=A0ABD5EV21_9ACTN|nr:MULTISPECIES: YfhO family protein [unclassified Streptomyces]MDT0437227.1 YfhO family protein [Streptomyces sp. DSM 41981]MYQ67125.1 YfhO family protein [Streptomyces sp. SID4950]SCE30299.1 membrane protein YfhO [Streptomyces sp. SolWspMP-5a-2]
MDRPTLRRAVSRGSSRPRRDAALLAWLLTAVLFCAADTVARGYPFGPRTRAVNDLGNQYVPFHAHLWDLLHGRADGGLLVNWQSGYGSSFLPDLGTYLSSPFALLVAVFPRAEIDLAVYVITVLKTACAGAAMAWLLLALRPGRRWAAGLLGTSYALCGWSVAVASCNPMWLDGLLALPLFCLVGEWALTGRRPLLGVLVVAEGWIANFYTAYMATLAAGLVLLLRLALADLDRARRVRAAARAAVTAALGIGLAAPLVAVVWSGTRHAYPGRAVDFTPVPARDLLARLLPTTYTFASPAVWVGTTALLLAFALPFDRRVPRRVRAGWTVLVAAVALSFQWGPTHLLWHAFATPQGSAYRQAFVLCGLLVMAAWTSFAHGPPEPRALAAAGALLGLTVAVASRSAVVHPVTWLILPLAVAGALGGLLLLARDARHPDARPARHPGARPARYPGGPRRALLAPLAVLLLFGGQFGETVATSAVASRLRLGHMDDYAPWGARQRAQAAAVASADDWPAHRTEPGREQTVGNDPLTVGGQGAQYYSSLTSDVLSRTLTALGGGWTSRGRSVQSLDNDVTDALFSVGARVHSPPDPHQTRLARLGGAPTVTRAEVPPLVTVRPPGTDVSSGFGPSPYRNQELLLGARVYTVPRLTVRAADGAPAGRYVGVPEEGTASGVTVTARCRPGRKVHLWAPHYSGTARLGTGPEARFSADERGTKIAAMEPLGTVPASGRVRIVLTPDLRGRVPDGAVGCLDTARLRTAVQRLRATGATRVRVAGATVEARLPAGSTGTAVVAAPRLAGWRCAAGAGPLEPARRFHGLIAVPLDGSATTVRCAFRPPGLRLGTAVGATALLALLLTRACAALRGRRAARPHRPTRPSATAAPPERVGA